MTQTCPVRHTVRSRPARTEDLGAPVSIRVGRAGAEGRERTAPVGAPRAGRVDETAAPVTGEHTREIRGERGRHRTPSTPSSPGASSRSAREEIP